MSRARAPPPSTKKVSAAPMEIDVCLFGPTRQCPTNVWDDVLSHDPKSMQTQPRAHVPPTHSVHDIGSLSTAQKIASQNRAKRFVALEGIDDLDHSRWGTGMNVATLDKGPHIISMQELRRVASQGIIDDGSHRPVAWRVLLGYLPLELTEWKASLLKQRTLYRNLVADLFVEPQHDGNHLIGRHGKRNWSQRKLAMATMGDDEHDNVYQSPINSPVVDKRKGMARAIEDLELLSMDINVEAKADGKTNLNATKAKETYKIIIEPGSEYKQSETNSENPQGGISTSDEMTDAKIEMDMPLDISDDHVDLLENACKSHSSGLDKSSNHSNTGSFNSINRRPSLTGDAVPPPIDTRPAAENITQSASIEDAMTGPKKVGDEEEYDEKGLAFTTVGTGRGLTKTASEWIKNNAEHSGHNKSFADNNGTDEVDDDGFDNDFVHKPFRDGVPRTRSETIPPRIREEWKKSGRDLQTLDQMGIMDQAMNTLLVLDNGREKGKQRISVSDDPLSTDADSKWFQFFENASLLDEIRKDVVRTHPDLFFFLEPENNLGQRRYAALERILFVWAKLNKGVRYVQGMNEIVGTIYYVLANDLNEEWACEAEADTYFLFNTLMTEMRDVFVPDLDEADTGIQGRISNMTALLSLHDPEVRCHLDDMGIDASFYAMRWLTTLLSREFLLPDTIRLWDSMFASTHKDNFMRYVCVTMVIIVRAQLLKGDFSTCLRLLQSYPTSNIDSLLESSRALWIYESQVTLACHRGGMSLHQALMTIMPPPSLHMAYGLVGGIAADKIPEDESPPSRGGFLSGARNMLGALASREGVRQAKRGWTA
jgi:Rab-GTPase-TBC domain